jgi:transcriptional regulator with XRE-family HTH domain
MSDIRVKRSKNSTKSWYTHRNEFSIISAGKTLSIYRTNSNMTISQLANLLGTTDVYIERLESDKTSISLELSTKLSLLFNVPKSRFYTRKTKTVSI